MYGYETRVVSGTQVEVAPKPKSEMDAVVERLGRAVDGVMKGGSRLEEVLSAALPPKPTKDVNEKALPPYGPNSTSRTRQLSDMALELEMAGAKLEDLASRVQV